MHPARGPSGNDGISAAQDPFYLVKEEVQGLLNSVQIKYRRWEQFSLGSMDGTKLGKELLVDCATINWQLDELDKAIAVAERDPARYGIDSAEISQRKTWTSSTRNQVKTMKTTVQDAPTIHIELTRKPVNTNSKIQKAHNAASHDDDDFYASESDKQALIMKEQDHDLDALSASVERIGDVSRTIHDELISQDRILEDLGQEMDNTANRLDFVQKKIAIVIKKAGAKGQIMLIIFLVILLLVLILLVFS